MPRSIARVIKESSALALVLSLSLSLARAGSLSLASLARDHCWHLSHEREPVSRRWRLQRAAASARHWRGAPLAKHLCVCARVCVRARERERARARERESAWERARGERACVLYPPRRSTSIKGRLVEQLHPLCMRTRHAAPQPARLPSRMGGWPPAGPFHLISRARAARPPVVAATRGCYAKPSQHQGGAFTALPNHLLSLHL